VRGLFSPEEQHISAAKHIKSAKMSAYCFLDIILLRRIYNIRVGPSQFLIDNLLLFVPIPGRFDDRFDIRIPKLPAENPFGFFL
jgi:hypothetical protein